MNVYLKYLLLWFPMLLLAVVNGTLRELVYKKYTGELLAHQLSTVSLILLFGIYIYTVTGKAQLPSSKAALGVGLLWLILTLLFEFGFGRFRGNSWEKLLYDYHIWEGRIWILIPCWVFIAPFIFYKWRN